MAEPILELRNVAKQFGALVACDAVSLDLQPGEIHALIGPNGAGKSTLIKQIAGELKPDAGTITFLGRDIAPLGVVERARLGLARTFQVSSLAPELSARQNVMLSIQGAQGATFRFFRSALKDPTLCDPADQFLGRVELSDRGDVKTGDLSHGERRKLEMAIALAMQPKAFLLDEPMAGMGPEGSKYMTGLLADLKSEAPILLVEHDMDAVFALADRISVLVYGRIIATGSVNEIRANAQVQEAYLGVDAE